MDIDALAAELTTDPLTRGYSGMSDAVAAADLNLVYRSADGGIDGMVRYLATHKNRTNEGGDTVGSAMLGRLKAVADSDIDGNPFRRGEIFTAGATGNNLDIVLADSPSNTITLGSAHTHSIAVMDVVELFSSTADDGRHHVKAVSGQQLTVSRIQVSETLQRVAKLTVVLNAKLVTIDHKNAAQSFIQMFMNPQMMTMDFLDTEIDGFYTQLVNAGVWKTADVDALKALSQNQQSRGVELGLGRVKEGHVAEARG